MPSKRCAPATRAAGMQAANHGSHWREDFSCRTSRKRPRRGDGASGAQRGPAARPYDLPVAPMDLVVDEVTPCSAETRLLALSAVVTRVKASA